MIKETIKEILLLPVVIIFVVIATIMEADE